MASYLTPAGLEIPLTQDIIGQIEAAMWATFGNQLNLLPSSVAGQWVSIAANLASEEWQNMQTVYNAWNPNTAGGVSLDNVVAVNGIRRLPATFGVGTLTINGTFGTVIAQGAMTAAVAGNPSAEFSNTVGGTIGAGTDAIQTISFSATPDAGQWTLIYNGNQTGTLNFNAAAIDVQNALRALAGLSDVLVTGSMAAGFTVTFTLTSGQQPQPTMSIGLNTLTLVLVPVSVTILTTVPGVFPHVDLPVQCLTTGDIPAYAGTLTVIVTPIIGVSSVVNADDIIPGQNIETDSALRIRRLNSVAFPGSSNIDSIRAKILQITGVVNCFIDNNVTLITNVNGTPGKAFQSIVLGGADQPIGQAIWDSGPAGILAYGTTTVTITDASGNPQTVGFSRPIQVPIYMVCYLKPLANYPVGGDEQLKEAIVSYGQSTFSVGQNVIYWQLNLPAGSISGIDDFSFTIGIARAPQQATLVWSANFVASNVINGKINGIPITPVPFNTNNATTLSNLATAIMALGYSASSDGLHTITVTGAAGVPFFMTNFLVTGGASQPTATVTITVPVEPSGTVDIPIGATEISVWDTANISVTHLP